MKNKANEEREQLWQERVAQLQASGVSQRAYAMEHGFSEHQIGYWVRRMTKPKSAPALLPVAILSPSCGGDEPAQRARLDVDLAQRCASELGGRIDAGSRMELSADAI